MTFVLSFVSIIVLCMEGKEAWAEEMEACMEENESLSR